MKGGGTRGEDALMSPPSAADATAVEASGIAGEENDAAVGAPRVELGYEPRYQR